MRIIVLSLLTAAGVSQTGHAADLLEPPPAEIAPEEFDKRWHVAVGAYVWAAGLEADVGVAGLGPASVSLGFGDILKDLDLALMAVAEVRYGRAGVFSDLFFTRLSRSDTFLSGFVDAGFSSHVFAGTLMGEYRALEQGRSSLDLMAGGRLWSVGGELDLTVPPLGASLERSDDETWVDPMLGLKGRLQGASPLYATAWGMVGGFGAGSDFAWDALAAVGYEVNDHVSLIAGYRAVGVDYSNDGFLFDAVLHGPVVSGIIRF